MSAVAEQSVISRAIEAMHSMPDDQKISMEPDHLFGPGVYIRVLRMPAGTVVASKIHKTEHFCIALKGRALVRVGDKVEEIVAPRIMRTLPGTQRMLYITKDAVWLTIHPLENADTRASEEDLKDIETRLIADSFEDPELVKLLADMGESE